MKPHGGLLRAFEKEKDMAAWILREEDAQQIERRGMTQEGVLSQIEMFKKGAPFLRLNRPCTVGDGIKKIIGDESHVLTARYQEYASKRAPTKFVPASGAASRMFKTLLRFDSENEGIHRDSFISKAYQGDADMQHLVIFMEGIEQFAFFDDLKSVMA
ncbi:MAG: DUF4301 family protein, partial [Deltaproteobacteria bacterium]|nr:DUF4301 family protein [Deltaproteobacteria bacterium]